MVLTNQGADGEIASTISFGMLLVWFLWKGIQTVVQVIDPSVVQEQYDRPIVGLYDRL